MLKRLFDIISASVGLVIALPMMLVIALLIRRNDGGQALYNSIRIGRAGKPFTMYKFRTMVQNADTMGGPSTASDDPRLTKIGLWLKRYQLDELPQLINVVKGDMSIVGPRPEVPHYVDMMSQQEKEMILSVRPGLTDWASLWNFHEGEILQGAADPEQAYLEKIRPEKIRLQLQYVRERNFLVDLGIIFQTIAKVFQ